MEKSLRLESIASEFEESPSPKSKDTHHWILRDLRLTGLGVGALLVITSRILTPYMTAATFSYACLLSGVCLRRERKAHVALMGIGILTDLAIVLTLEFKRNAIKTALAFSLSPIQQLHIGTSTIATILYIPVVTLGVMRLLGNGNLGSRIAHMRLGITAFVFRTLGFILMFSLLWKKP